MADSKKKTADQPAEDYPDLSSEAAAEAAASEAAEPEAAEVTESVGPKFNPKKQFSMCWHDGLKAYVQDGIVFDRGTKEPVGKL
jgi:hypothetical protein